MQHNDQIMLLPDLSQCELNLRLYICRKAFEMILKSNVRLPKNVEKMCFCTSNNKYNNVTNGPRAPLPDPTLPFMFQPVGDLKTTSQKIDPVPKVMNYCTHAKY